MLTKNEYIVVSYGKAVILYTQPIKIDIGNIDLNSISTINFHNRILGKIKALEDGYGGSIWPGSIMSNGLMLINSNDIDYQEYINIHGFEEYVKSSTSCWDAKFFKLVPDNPNNVMTLMDLFILGFTG